MIRAIADGVIVVFVSIVMLVGVMAIAAETKRIEIRDHSCPDMPQDVLDARESASVDALRAALNEAIVFWEACRLGSQQ